ncbi:hypothetical protein ScPMuIL_007370, partial [Solemya velum]
DRFSVRIGSRKVEVFYEDLLGGKIYTKQYRPNQKGGRRRPYVIPVSRITPMKAVEN